MQAVKGQNKCGFTVFCGHLMRLNKFDRRSGKNRKSVVFIQSVINVFYGDGLKKYTVWQLFYGHYMTLNKYNFS